MAEKKLSLQDRLLAAAVVFGDAGNVHDIEFRLKAYIKLLQLGDEIEPGCIEEFDVINALEDLPSFKPREELRKLANDLKLLERQEDGLLRLKAKIHLDDYCPGEFPFAAPAAVPVDFVREPKHRANDASLGSADALRLAIEALSLTIETCQQAQLPLITAQLALKIDTKQVAHLSFMGTKPATTPFLDLYVLTNDIIRLAPDLAQDTIAEIRQMASPWLDTYLNKHLLVDDGFDDSGALWLDDDDDYPGAKRPAVLSNAELISVLIQESEWRKRQNQPQRPKLMEIILGLTQFVLKNQNPDGGWPIYRYRSERFNGKPTLAPSLPLFSFVAYAGLIDAFFDGPAELQDTIIAAVNRYGELIKTRARRFDDDSVGWAADFSADAHVDLGETATHLQACLLLPLILKDQEETFKGLASAAVRHIASRWQPAADIFGNIHRITFRPPTEEGSAGLPVSWKHPGHAKILRALAQAYLNGIDPGFDGAARMATAAGILARDCQQGFWFDINRENMAKSVIKVNTGIISATALLFYEAALAKSTAPSRL